MSTLPLVLLLDMDHTIVGECSMQVARYSITTYLKHKHDVKSLMDDLENGLLRPYFESCIKLILTKYSNAELFIFTAAEKKWAHIMINCIEKLLNIKFNRPIFSREYCTSENGYLKKNITKLAPIIYRKLKSKYRLTHINQLKKQIVLIDNSHVVGENDAHRFIKCPSYEYCYPCDVLEGLSKSKIKHHMTSIGTIIQKYSGNTNLNATTDFLRFMSLYYAFLSEHYKNTSSQSNKNRKDLDTFWLMVEKIFRNHNIHSFSVKVVTYMNKNVRV